MLCVEQIFEKLCILEELQQSAQECAANDVSLDTIEEESNRVVIGGVDEPAILAATASRGDNSTEQEVSEVGALNTEPSISAEYMQQRQLQHDHDESLIDDTILFTSPKLNTMEMESILLSHYDAFNSPMEQQHEQRSLARELFEDENHLIEFENSDNHENFSDINGDNHNDLLGDIYQSYPIGRAHSVSTEIESPPISPRLLTSEELL